MLGSFKLVLYKPIMQHVCVQVFPFLYLPKNVVYTLMYFGRLPALDSIIYVDFVSTRLFAVVFSRSGGTGRAAWVYSRTSVFIILFKSV